MEVGKKKKEERYIMAKAVFAGKEVKKLSPKNRRRNLAPMHTILSGFPKNFFLGNGPGNTGYWDSQDKQI